MLSPLQIKRLLKHCEKIDSKNEENKSNLAGNEYFEYIRNKGWCHALRLVLEQDTAPINNKPLEEK